MVNLACEVCQKRIENDQDVVKIEVGKRNTGLLPGYTGPNQGLAAIHINCLKVEHDEQYPEKTAYQITKQLEAEK